MAVWPYNTQRWQRLRKQKLSTDPFCEYRFPGCLTMADQVDHKQAIEAGGSAWAWDNLASACQPCHSRKTRNIDMLGRDSVPVRGCDESGWPVDSDHLWNTAKRIALSLVRACIPGRGGKNPSGSTG